MFNKLYDYQKEILEITKQNNKGIICLPTGTGKTFCQASIIADDIINSQTKDIYVVNAPRILLSYQLLKETYSFLINLNIEARYMFVHSGGSLDEKELEEIRMTSDIPYSQILSGTNINQIQEIIQTSKKQNLPLIFFSTYNSANKIEIAREKENVDIKIVLNDEAHYLIQEQFHNIIHILKSNKYFFFTATTIHTPSDKGKGMNNVDIYGELLYYMSPREAIDKGKMVRPRIHILTTKDVYSSDDFKNSLNKIIYEAFIEHKSIIKIKPKLLISVKGTLDIKKFLISNEYKILRELGVNIYAISSNPEIGNNINNNQVNRQTFLKSLKEFGEKPNEELIVLHYDILSEGIDISGFTGLLPLRTLSKSKFLQTYGRCARLYKTDKLLIENKLIDVNDLDNLNKPYSYIIIPNVIQSENDDKENLKNLIYELRDYGFKPYEDILSINYINGIPKPELLEGMNTLISKFPNIGELIENIESVIEDEKNAKLSKNEFLDKLFDFN
jgi:superfamily II DNA or RNA helicase